MCQLSWDLWWSCKGSANKLNEWSLTDEWKIWDQRLTSILSWGLFCWRWAHWGLPLTLCSPRQEIFVIVSRDTLIKTGPVFTFWSSRLESNHKDPQNIKFSPKSLDLPQIWTLITDLYVNTDQVLSQVSGQPVGLEGSCSASHAGDPGSNPHQSLYHWAPGCRKSPTAGHSSDPKKVRPSFIVAARSQTATLYYIALVIPINRDWWLFQGDSTRTRTRNSNTTARSTPGS